MIISTEWLKEHIDFKLSLNELEEGLTSLGLECAVKSNNSSFTDIVVGKIISVNKVKDSDHLNQCLVNVGDKTLDIICGAPNVKEGINVPVAIPGATLDNGNYTIKKTKIRGYVSNGMICSEKELTIGDNHDGIMILDGKLKLGDDFSNIYNLDRIDTIDSKIFTNLLY